jgi:hypothetical protein
MVALRVIFVSCPSLHFLTRFARVAELVDAADLKSADRKVVQVQVLFRAPYKRHEFSALRILERHAVSS